METTSYMTPAEISEIIEAAITKGDGFGDTNPDVANLRTMKIYLYAVLDYRDGNFDFGNETQIDYLTPDERSDLGSEIPNT